MHIHLILSKYIMFFDQSLLLYSSRRTSQHKFFGTTHNISFTLALYMIPLLLWHCVWHLFCSDIVYDTFISLAPSMAYFFLWYHPWYLLALTPPMILFTWWRWHHLWYSLSVSLYSQLMGSVCDILLTLLSLWHYPWYPFYYLPLLSSTIHGNFIL